MHFPVADIQISPFIPPLVAFLISLFTSMSGVSGAFLLLPFQVSILGFTTPAVSATNQLFNIISIPSGVYRYIREDRMVWPLVWMVIIGTLPGVFLGAIVRIRFLLIPKNFKIFVGLVLLYIGLRLLKDIFIKSSKEHGAFAEEPLPELRPEDKSLSSLPSRQRTSSRVTLQEWNLMRIVYDFSGQTFEISVLGILAVSFVVGTVGGIYGIGGGAILSPLLVSVWDLPVYTIAGAALMGTFITSFVGVLFYQALAAWYPQMAISPDWALGILFGLGGCAGMYCGARLQKFVPEKIITGILVLCLFFTAVKYILEFFG